MPDDVDGPEPSKPSRPVAPPRSSRTGAASVLRSTRRGAAWMQRHPVGSVLVLTVHRIAGQHLSTHAAAIAFQMVISLFPLIAAVVAGASFFIEPAALTNQILKFASDLAPKSGDVLTSTIRSVTDLRGQIGAVSLAGLLWTGSNVFGALRLGLNAAVGSGRRRRFLHARAFDLTVAALTSVLLAGSVAITGALVVLERLETFGAGTALAPVGAALRIVGIGIPLATTTFIFAVLYRVVPATNLPWRAALGGGALAALLFEGGKNLFVWYAGNFASFNAVYGPISTVVVLLVWLYYSGLIVLVGAALGSSLTSTAAFRRRHAAQPGMPSA